jgi:hypothetical protein
MFSGLKAFRAIPLSDPFKSIDDFTRISILLSVHYVILRFSRWTNKSTTFFKVKVKSRRTLGIRDKRGNLAFSFFRDLSGGTSAYSS